MGKIAQRFHAPYLPQYGRSAIRRRSRNPFFDVWVIVAHINALPKAVIYKAVRLFTIILSALPRGILSVIYGSDFVKAFHIKFGKLCKSLKKQLADGLVFVIVVDGREHFLAVDNRFL